MTVVVATRGPSPFLEAAVAGALAERPHELLVVEDGTRGVSVREDAAMRVLHLHHVGRSAARNAGVEAAATPFVAFLDDDDLVLPGRLRRQRARLLSTPAAPLAFGRVRVVDGERRPVPEWNATLDRRFRRLPRDGIGFSGLLAARAPVYTSATMVRRDSFLHVGGYDAGLDAYEDLDLYLRLSELGPLLPCFGEPVAEYRLHGANTPSPRLYEGALAVTAKHLPLARGRKRRLLWEWRVDALWGLRRIEDLRREGLGAARADPLLLLRPGFTKRLLAAAFPTRLCTSRP